MTDLERLAIARDIIHSDAASAFEDVLMKRGKGYMVPNETMNMALTLEKLYKVLHPHPGCPHPKWDEESAVKRCPCGDALSMLDDGHGNKREACYRCQEEPKGCVCPHPQWHYDVGKPKEASEGVCASSPCPGPDCPKSPAWKCFSRHERDNLKGPSEG